MIKNVIPRLVEIGKIKIGGKGAERKAKGSQKMYRLPVKFDHFLVTTTDKDGSGNFIPDNKVMEVLGKKPTEIPIRLPFDDIDMNFFTSYQFYQGRKCICRGDGEKAVWSQKDKEPKTIKCDPEKCEYNLDRKCKISGILSCMLPASDNIGGVYRFRTHGWNSVSGILAALQYFQKNTNGVLQGLPLKLKYIKKSTEEHGSVPVVTIVLDAVELFAFRELALEESMNRERLNVDIKLLESSAKDSGFMEDTDDAGDVQDEFYSEGEPEPGTGTEELGAALEDKKKAAKTEKVEKAEVVDEESDDDSVI